MNTYSSVRRLLSDAYNTLGTRLPLLFALMITAGLLEGLGLALLFPLLEKLGLGGNDATATSPLAEMTGKFLEIIGLSDSLTPVLVFSISILLVQVSIIYLRTRIETGNQTRYTSSWHTRLFSATMDAGWLFLLRQKKARQINTIMSETSRTSAALALMMQIANNAVFAVIYAAVALTAAWQIVVILVVCGGFMYLSTRPLTRRSRQIGIDVTTVAEDLQHRTGEFLHSAKLIKASATEASATALFGDASERYRRVYFRAGTHPALIYAIYMAGGYLLIGVCVWLAVMVIALEPRSIIVAMYVFLRLYNQVSNLQQNVQALAICIAAFDTVSSELAAARAAAENGREGMTLPGSGPVAIATSGLSLRYGRTEALKDVNLSIAAGDLIGITGPSGAGKSTLVDAIVGLLPPSGGKVLVNGTDVRELDTTAWRRSIGYVGQETLLLNGTVAENIAWGTASPHSDAVVAAARLADADAFVRQLEQGYDTLIGEHGVRLSGGQRQRLGLARALLGEKRLLILDEATSALDAESEHEVLNAIQSLRRNVTILMVAHRLMPLSSADRILLFEGGELAETGTFEELVATNGRFAHLWELQNQTTGVA